jgi:type II secretory pathway pseudopilin PulG
MLGRRARCETGETLVEVLVAVVILGLAGVALMAGLGLSAKASDLHRKETTSGAYVRSYAEAIANYVATPGASNYKPCAPANWYNVSAVTATLNLPSGYAATQDAAKSVGTNGVAAAGCTLASDTGVQQLTLHVTSPNSSFASETLVIVVRKPCDPSVAACS